MNKMRASLDVLSLTKELLKDLGMSYCDRKYVLRRIANEGISFLTRTLPTLTKQIVCSIEQGILVGIPTSFAVRKALPLFLRGWVCQIFDENTGVLLTNPCPVAIYQIRQLEIFYKLDAPLTEEASALALEKFLATEKRLETMNHDYQHYEKMRKLFESTYPSISEATVHDIMAAFRPRHTSGTYAECERDWYVTKVTALRTHRPDLSGYFKPYPGYSPRRLGVNHLKNSIPEVKKLSEVLFVPKDSRGPRTIVREPRDLIPGQMSFHDFLSSKLQYLSKGRVNFTDQTINRNLALSASKDRRYATIDVSDASDSISLQCVRYVLRNFKGLKYFLQHFRSTHALLPDGKVIKLSKLSGMGSGFTFPVMALLFQLSIAVVVKGRIPSFSYDKILSKIYVYGDDIIIPNAWVAYAYKALELIGAVPSKNKSFSRSHFRESCGGEFYNGNDVGITRLKFTGCDLTLTGHMLEVPTQKLDNFIVKLIVSAQELAQRGLDRTAEVLYTKAEAFLGLSLPFCEPGSGVLGRTASRDKVVSYVDAITVDNSLTTCGLLPPVVIPVVTPKRSLKGKMEIGVFLGHWLRLTLTEEDRPPLRPSVPREFLLKKRTKSAMTLFSQS